MSREKLTPWFPADVAPVRAGMYRAQDKTMNCNCCWIDLFWNGSEWRSKDWGQKGFYRHFFTSHLLRWRGLAQEGPKP